MYEEFMAAEDLLDRAGLLDTNLPIPLDSVIEYLAKDGLELHYYDPKLAPESVKNAAYGVDEVLHWKDGTAALFINQSRPRTRQRFSLCHGIGHFLLPYHRELNYLARGCNTMRPLTTKPYERQADRFAAALNMPPTRFRQDMKTATPGMTGILELASSYSASIESAAIHYVGLAEVPCSLLRLDLVKIGPGSRDGPYKVRYQIRNDQFPFLIPSGLRIEKFPDEIVDWKPWQGQYMPEGLVYLESIGPGQVGREVALRSYTYPHRAGVLGGVLALLFLAKPLKWAFFQ
ncbi:MAG: ImmA/IrrE family metallo-endopeptidase [Chloroflexi bacterium]|nr:ImmA/IrrE family metallo-endopeptidase [Chloroflexota bacterium]